MLTFSVTDKDGKIHKGAIINKDEPQYQELINRESEEATINKIKDDIVIRSLLTNLKVDTEALVVYNTFDSLDEQPDGNTKALDLVSSVSLSAGGK